MAAINGNEYNWHSDPGGWKRCFCPIHCGEPLPLGAFEKVKVDSHGHQYRRGVCKYWHITSRHERKARDPYLAKAYRTIKHHALTAIEAGLVKTRQEFIDKYGWQPERVAAAIRHAHEQGRCFNPHTGDGCRKTWTELGGLPQVTIDIVDPTKEPYWSNTQVICLTCNGTKQDQTPEQQEFDREGWRRFEEARQRNAGKDPRTGTPQIEGWSA